MKEEKQVKESKNDTPKTIEELFAKEYLEMKDKVEWDYSVIECQRNTLTRLADEYEKLEKAIKALNPILDKDGYIHVGTTFFGKLDEGYADIKNYIEGKKNKNNEEEEKDE